MKDYFSALRKGDGTASPVFTDGRPGHLRRRYYLPNHDNAARVAQAPLEEIAYGMGPAATGPLAIRQLMIIRIKKNEQTTPSNESSAASR